MKNQYDKLMNEMNQAKEEIKETREELKQEKFQHEQTKEKLEITTKEMNHIKEEIAKTQEELKQEKFQHEQTKKKLQITTNEINKAKDEHEQTKGELSQCKFELKKFNDEKNQHAHNIVVSGYDKYNQVGEKPNNKDISNTPIIFPPIILSFNHSQLLFYTAYGSHSVIYDKCSSLKGIGYNTDGSISSSLEKTILNHFTEFSIKDSSGSQLEPVSAVASSNGVLYIFSKVSDNRRHLVLCDHDIKGGDPVFLNIGNHHRKVQLDGQIILVIQANSSFNA